MNQKRPPKRKGRRARFKTGVDDERQLQEITDAQKLARAGKRQVPIESNEKSRQRVKNRLREIKNVEDAKRQFEK